LRSLKTAFGKRRREMETVTTPVDGFKLRFISGKDLSNIKPKERESIACLYRDVFNEDWGENWTFESALKEVSESFTPEEGREPLVTLLYAGDEIVGFAWAVKTSKNRIEVARDLPYGIPPYKKTEAKNALCYWLDAVVGKSRVLVFREIGVLKKYRERASAYLTYPIIKDALESGYETLFFWTSPESAAFKLGLGLRWNPFHVLPDSGLALMGGSVCYSASVLEKILSVGRESRLGIKEMLDNIKTYGLS
jgi:hypothetical protein